MTRRPRKRKAIRPAPGDFILVGAPGVVMQHDWFLAKVLSIDGDDVVTEHEPPGGTKYRQILHVDRVRAIGSIAELVQLELVRRMRKYATITREMRVMLYGDKDEVGETR